MKEREQYQVGDVIRMRNTGNDSRGFQVWKVVGVALGALGQESNYQLRRLDASDNTPGGVPTLMLETHPGVERV